MTNLLKYPLNIQLFAEDDPAPAPQPAPVPQPGPAVEINYEKLAEVVEGRSTRAGDAALKDYLKQQGLTKEECDNFIVSYKEAQSSKQRKQQEEYQKIIDENKAYKKAEALKAVKNTAKEVAKELNVRDDRFDKLFKLSDTTKFAKDDGKIDKDAIKAEFEEQLKELPEFTSKKRIVISTGDGFNGKPREATDAEEYRKQKYGKSKYFRG